MEDDGEPKSACDSVPGMVEMKGECYKLYTQGKFFIKFKLEI
jgi:hypothetical protein